MGGGGKPYLRINDMFYTHKNVGTVLLYGDKTTGVLNFPLYTFKNFPVCLTCGAEKTGFPPAKE